MGTELTQHLMLDMETLGNKPDTVVMSLAGVILTRDAIVSAKEWTLNTQQQLNGGRKIDMDTVCWWLKQEQNAQNIIRKSASEGQDMRSAMTEFTSWVKNIGNKRKILVWSCGATFDISIAENILNSMKLEVPWEYTNQRCYRTVKAMHKVEQGLEFKGQKHVAIDDCMHQALALMNFFKLHPELEA